MPLKNMDFFVGSPRELRPLGAPGSIFLARGAIAPSRAAFKVAPADYRKEMFRQRHPLRTIHLLNISHCSGSVAAVLQSATLFVRLRAIAADFGLKRGLGSR